MPVIFIQKGITPSNKTEKYGLQLTANAYGYKNSKGYQVNTLYPVIDKLSVTVPVDEEDRKAIDEALMDIHKNEEDFSSVSAKGKRYKKNIEWTDKKTGQKVLIQCDPVYAKNYLRFELNPARLGPEGMSRFKKIFEYGIAVGNYPYSRVLETGYIRRADVAVDMINVAPHELIVAGKDTGKSIMFLGKGSNEIETVYLDKPKTKSSYKMVYNKLQEQIDKGDEPSFNDVLHTRAEYTHAGAPFSNIPNIQNPFKKMTAFNPIYSPDGMEDWVWELFLDSCRLKGVEAALSHLPLSQQGACKKALKKAEDVTWRPEKLWEKWESYLQKSGVLTDN